MANQQGSFKINLGVVNDEAIKKLKELNSQLYKAQAPLKAYQRELKKFNELSGRTANLKRLEQGLSGVKNKLGQVAGIASSAGKSVLALAGIGSIAGVVALTRSFANWGNEIRNASALLDITSTKAAQLQQYSKLSGAGDQTQQLKTFQDKQTAIQYGQDASGAYANNILGITPRMGLEQAQIQASKRIHELLKSGKINATGARNLADESGVGEIAITRTADELEQLQKKARANAAEMARFAGPAAKLRDTMAEASGRVDVLKTRLAASLSPVITPLLQKFIDWSNDNKAVSETMDKITNAAKLVGQWIQNIDVKKLQEQFSNLIKVGEILVGVFVGLKAISLASWSVSLVSDILKITKALGGLSKAGGVATSVGSALEGAGGAGAALGTVGVVGGAAAAAGYGVYKGASEVYHDFFTDKGEAEGRKARMKDKRYGSAWETNLSKNQDQFKLMQYAVNKEGLTPVQAAGLVAQMRQESGFNTQAIGDGGSAIGGFQWHKDRQKAIENHFNKKITNMSQEEQLSAALWEMRQGGEKKAGKLLMSAKTVDDAAYAGLSSERPAEFLKNGRNGSEQANRTRLAKAALDGYNMVPSQASNQQTAQPSKIDLGVTVTDGRKIKTKVTNISNPNLVDFKHVTRGGNTSHV